jgi:ATP-dependent Clp protease ATP-binding subunit ClpA
VLERLSDRARRVLELAESEARRMGHQHVGTEHLLLGLLAEGESGAARALVAAGARLDAARERVAEAVGRDDRDPGGGPAELPYTRRAARALERASRLSLQRRDELVGTEHMLLSVLDVEGTAGQVLRRLGVDIAGLHDSVDLDDGDGRVAAPAPSSGEAAPPTREPVAAGARAGRTAPPRCPDCRAALDGALAYRLVVGRGRGDSRRFVVAYCSACGSALGATAE